MFCYCRDIRQGRESRVRLVALRNNTDIQQQSIASKVCVVVNILL